MRLSTSVTFWLVATVFASNCSSVLPTWATFEPRRVICASMASRAFCSSFAARIKASKSAACFFVRLPPVKFLSASSMIAPPKRHK